MNKSLTAPERKEIESASSPALIKKQIERQSSPYKMPLEIFGTIDLGYESSKQNGVSAERMTSGGNQASKFGIKGKQELGYNITAGFWLEMGISPDSGSGVGGSGNNQTATTNGDGLIFGRRSTISVVEQKWGELRLGRDRTPLGNNIFSTDPFGLTGIGSNGILLNAPQSMWYGSLSAQRVSNSLQYYTPESKLGFIAQLTYALGENTSSSTTISGEQKSTKDDGKYYGLRAGYAFSNFETFIASGTSKVASSGDLQSSSIALIIKNEFFKISGLAFTDRKNTSSTPNRSSGYQLGLTIEFNKQHQLKANYGIIMDNSEPSIKQSNLNALGYVYNMPKGFSIYVTQAIILNKGGATSSGGGVPGAADQNYSGTNFGLKMAF